MLLHACTAAGQQWPDSRRQAHIGKERADTGTADRLCPQIVKIDTKYHTPRAGPSKDSSTDQNTLPPRAFRLNSANEEASKTPRSLELEERG